MLVVGVAHPVISRGLLAAAHVGQEGRGVGAVPLSRAQHPVDATSGADARLTAGGRKLHVTPL